jgi:hypothetical protein
MFTQEIQTPKQRQEIAKQKAAFNQMLNQKLNATYNHLPTFNEVKVAETITTDFENTKQQNLHEFKRFLNVATQIAQGTKSIRQANKIKTDSDKVKQLLTGIKSDETPEMVFKKMSNALILISQMITNTADVSKSATLSSVANSVLTRDIGKALQKRR